MNRRLMLILALGPLGLILALVLLTLLPGPPKAVSVSPPAAPPAPRMIEDTAPPYAAPPPPPLTMVPTSALSSPRSAVDSAARFLEANDEGRFRQTLLPAVSGQLTPEQFARCRARVAQGPLTPDWETAVRATEGGHEVVRVSLFGKALTGFHELGGRWLADSPWCLPTSP